MRDEHKAREEERKAAIAASTSSSGIAGVGVAGGRGFAGGRAPGRGAAGRGRSFGPSKFTVVKATAIRPAATTTVASSSSAAATASASIMPPSGQVITAISSSSSSTVMASTTAAISTEARNTSVLEKGHNSEGLPATDGGTITTCQPCLESEGEPSEGKGS